MRVTLDIPDRLLQKATLHAAKEGVSLEQLMSRALEAELPPLPARSDEPAPWQIPLSPHPLNDRNLDWDQIRAVLDAESDAHWAQKLK